MDLRSFISWAEDAGTLANVVRTVDPHLELARVMYALDDRPVLFRRLTGFPGWHALSGPCAQRQHFAAALNCTVSDLVQRMADALAHPAPPPMLDSGPCQETVEVGVNLTHLPIPRYHPDDGGRYITSGVAAVKDPDLGRNISFHRLMLLDERRLTARIVEGRGTHTALSKIAGDYGNARTGSSGRSSICL